MPPACPPWPPHRPGPGVGLPYPPHTPYPPYPPYTQSLAPHRIGPVDYYREHNLAFWSGRALREIGHAAA
ncbi:hypothetical protein SALBM135S_08589 [Streptomyces alboniger]